MSKIIRLPAGFFAGLSLALACSLHMAAATAQAVDRATGLQPGVKTLSTFAKPYDAAHQSRLPASALTWPMPVLASDRDFLKVMLEGKEVWIDGADVVLEKPVPYECVVTAKPKPGKVAATQGASSGCK